MSVANTYAKALFESVQEKGQGQNQAAVLDQLENQLDAFIQTVDSSRDLAAALFAPITTSKEKTGLISELGPKMGAGPLLTNFLTLLAKKGRLSLIREIREALTTVRLQAEGGVSGRLESAEPMSESDIQSLAQAFSRKLGKKVTFRASTNPSLLAGVKVTVNGVTYDGTLRAQLQQLRDRLVVGAPGASGA